METACIKWGILGTSPISETIAHAMQSSTMTELHAIAGRSLTKSQQFAEKFSVLKYFDNYQAVLDDPSIQAVYIGLPNPLHKEWIIRCAQAGKHILCEKPFVTTMQEAKEIQTELKLANVFCMEALMYRSHPMIKKLMEIVHNKVIGNIKSINAAYMANIAHLENPISKSAIYNLGCYPVSLVRLMAACELGQATTEPLEMVSLGSLAEDGCDNQASILLKFENNILATITTADDVGKYAQFSICGTEGHLVTQTNPWMPEQINNTIMIYRYDEPLPFEVKVMADKPLYTYQIDILNQAILQGKMQDGITWEDSMGNVAVLETWYQQVKNKEHKLQRSLNTELLS